MGSLNFHFPDWQVQVTQTQLQHRSLSNSFGSETLATSFQGRDAGQPSSFLCDLDEFSGDDEPADLGVDACTSSTPSSSSSNATDAAGTFQKPAAQQCAAEPAAPVPAASSDDAPGQGNRRTSTYSAPANIYGQHQRLAAVSLIQLPEEVLLQALGLLSPHDWSALAQTCVQLRHTALHAALWTPTVHTRRPWQPPAGSQRTSQLSGFDSTADRSSGAAAAQDGRQPPAAIGGASAAAQTCSRLSMPHYLHLSGATLLTEPYSPTSATAALHAPLPHPFIDDNTAAPASKRSTAAATLDVALAAPLASSADEAGDVAADAAGKGVGATVAAAAAVRAASVRAVGGVLVMRRPAGGHHGQHRLLRSKLAACAGSFSWLNHLGCVCLHMPPEAALGFDAATGRLTAGWGFRAVDVSMVGSGLQELQWLLAKSMAVAGRVGQRFHGSWQTHDQVRVALCTLWQEGPLADATMVQRQLLKLTRLSWALTYEALCAAFEAAADCLALQLRALLQHSGQEGGGRAAWLLVLAGWEHYQQWLVRVIGMAGLLGECVSAERAAEMLARGRPDTPSLFDVGRVAFRSQVVVAYGLRKSLQAALLADAAAAAPGSAHSSGLGDIMLDIRRLLEALDVADDATQVEERHTRLKFRRCFGLEPGTAQLRLVGALRVPPLQ